jgi:hypothetical protein
VLLLEGRYHGHHRFDKAGPFGLSVLELPLRQYSLHLPPHLIQLCLALEAVVIRSLPAARATAASTALHSQMAPPLTPERDIGAGCCVELSIG